MTKIAILGCGTVGAGLVSLLHSKNGAAGTDEIEIKKVLELIPSKARALGLTDGQICSDLNEILNDSEISIVVELMGGTGVAFEFISAALKAKKHVVTANKDLLAVKWNELQALARENGVELMFEASVGGAIPIIAPVRATLAANRFKSLVGILNGTTNYILTRMAREGCSYETALTAAQELGYAERDPSSDVEGLDAARKIVILAHLAFGADARLEDVQREGIGALTSEDIALAKSMGCAIKLVAGAVAGDKGVSLFVKPAFVPLSHPLASVNGVYNALFLSGDFCGNIMLYGRGAGARPTASSVAGDILDICRGIAAGASFPRFESVSRPECGLLKVGELVSGSCIRMTVEDKPRVLEGVAGAFGKNSISLHSVAQRPLGEGEAELVLISHPAREEELASALAELEGREYVKSIRRFMCLDEVREDAL